VAKSSSENNLASSVALVLSALLAFILYLDFKAFYEKVLSSNNKKHVLKLFTFA